MKIKTCNDLSYYIQKKLRKTQFLQTWQISPENRKKRNSIRREYNKIPTNREKINKASRVYAKTKQGKEIRYRARAKRDRNFGFEPLFDNPFNCPVDWHHISDIFVVAIPRTVHKTYCGLNHRQNLKPIVEKLYQISYIVLESK